MSGNEVAEKVTKWRAWVSGFVCEGCARSGMIFFADDFIGVRVGFGFEILLPFRGEFSQIMPQPGEVSPLVGGFPVWPRREHLSGESRRPPGDFVQMAVKGIERRAKSAFFPSQSRTIRRKKRFPFFRRFIFQRMGVKIHGGCLNMVGFRPSGKRDHFEPEASEKIPSHDYVGHSCKGGGTYTVPPLKFFSKLVTGGGTIR